MSLRASGQAIARICGEYQQSADYPQQKARHESGQRRHDHEAKDDVDSPTHGDTLLLHLLRRIVVVDLSPRWNASHKALERQGHLLADGTDEHRYFFDDGKTVERIRLLRAELLRLVECGHDFSRTNMPLKRNAVSAKTFCRSPVST